MIYQKKTINNVPTKIPLSNSAPVGNPIGTIISTYKKIQPRNYLYCDGSTFDETLYPALYLYLGTNVLPDYRECAIVGAEKNTTDVFDSTEIDPSTGLAGTQNHDVYTQGQFKDDQLQEHKHYQKYGTQYYSTGTDTWANIGDTPTESRETSTISTGRKGTTTRGKRKAVYYYIKAVDGVDISDEDTFLNTVKNYVDEKTTKIPDYSRLLQLGITDQGYKVSEDCYVVFSYITTASSANIALYIDGNNVLNVDSTVTGSTKIYVASFCGYVKKGQFVRFERDGGYVSLVGIKFYRLSN